MKKYKFMFIACFIIVLGCMIYAFLPKIRIATTDYIEKKDGNKEMSQKQLRASSVGEAYIPEDVIEYNKNVQHKDVVISDDHLGDMGGESEVYATPIYGGEEVARHFKNISDYYRGEIKLEEAFYNYIPELLVTTASMGKNELMSYYELNADLIEKKLGIISPEDFVKFIGSMDKLNGKKYINIDIPSNAITENYTDLSINFLIELTLEDGRKVAPVAINISHLKSSVNQAAPYIKFMGLYNSQRAE